MNRKDRIGKRTQSRFCGEKSIYFSGDYEGTLIRLGQVRDIKAENFPANSTVSIISNGKILFSEAVKHENSFTKEFEIQKDSYFRLEIRDADKKNARLDQSDLRAGKQVSKSFEVF
ncbi:MAG TPA: hypothetical protein VNI84_03570 [Pyrinomonadaceae bacterium]|nr:hypothetical protein [Pyrinomonadaceae bacterium]